VTRGGSDGADPPAAANAALSLNSGPRGNQPTTPGAQIVPALLKSLRLVCETQSRIRWRMMTAAALSFPPQLAGRCATAAIVLLTRATRTNAVRCHAALLLTDLGE
jgi:hypothetical protein